MQYLVVMCGHRQLEVAHHTRIRSHRRPAEPTMSSTPHKRYAPQCTYVQSYLNIPAQASRGRRCQPSRLGRPSRQQQRAGPCKLSGCRGPAHPCGCFFQCCHPTARIPTCQPAQPRRMATPPRHARAHRDRFGSTTTLPWAFTAHGFKHPTGPLCPHTAKRHVELLPEHPHHAHAALQSGLCARV